ncbi:MAG TPA: TetR/AcrR family transcriptional regulator [Nocardioides sp.]
MDPEVTRAILDAAVSVVAQGGFGGFTMDAVAKQAGCGKPAVYRRWDSKEALLEDAVVEAADARVRTPDTGSLRTDLHALLHEFIDWLGTPNGRVMVALIAEAVRDNTWSAAVTRSQRRRREQTRVLVDRAIERGEVPEWADADLLMDHAAAPIWMQVLVWRGEVASDPDYVARLTDSALAAAGLSPISS